MSKRPAKAAKPSSSGKAGSSKLRIIGGEWRSRQLPIPTLEGLRPTPDRVRETLFNWLNFDIPGAHCLDLFCGSGALGLEALSRDAAACTFVDASAVVAKQIKDNLATLKATNGQVHHTSALTYLHTPPARPFDVVFLDPPFRHNWLEQVIPLLSVPGWLSSGSYVYLERESEAMIELPSTWIKEKEKVAGQLTYSLYRVEGVENEDSQA